jgi:hypothetical protein
MCENVTFKSICKDCHKVLNVRKEKYQCDRFERQGVCSHMGFTRQEIIEVPKGFQDSCDCGGA